MKPPGLMLNLSLSRGFFMLNGLLIEDSLEITEVISYFLEKECKLHTAKNLSEATDLIQGNEYQFAIIDLKLQKKGFELEGLDALSKLKDSTYKIVFSGENNFQTIEKAFNRGADQYIAKENLSKSLKEQVLPVIRQLKNSHKEDQVSNKLPFATDKVRGQVLEAIKQVEFLPLILLGETGTGKSTLAKSIHELKGLDSKTFIGINLSEIPKDLVASTLFGHEKGAFTGANSKKVGLLEKTNGGTLFLDEISTLSADIQLKLLKFLDEGEFYPLGSETPVKSNFNLISATCEDLEKQVQSGQFRMDLYFRLRGRVITLPTLRSQRNQIESFVKWFILNSPKKASFGPEAITYLKNYFWPGNLREFHFVLKDLVQSSRGRIKASQLPAYILENRLPFEKRSEERLLLTPFLESLVRERGLTSFLGDLEREVIKVFLEKNENKVNQTARNLKISKSVLYRIIGSQKAV